MIFSLNKRIQPSSPQHHHLLPIFQIVILRKLTLLRDVGHHGTVYSLFPCLPGRTPLRLVLSTKNISSHEE